MMDHESKNALWHRMSRKMNANAAPPILKEKWVEAAANKARETQNKMFDTFLCCGGNCGRMIAIEETVQTKSVETIDDEDWFTEAELIEKLGEKKAKALISSKKNVPWWSQIDSI